MFPMRADRASQEAAQDKRISDPEDSEPQDSGLEHAARPPDAPAEQPELDVFAQLSKLIRLHDRGALSDEEFEAEKRRLLG
jgi:hypothetical protein